MYLENKIDELFETYIKSFNKKNKTSLETLEKNEKKNRFSCIKMALTEQVKILDDKIKANKAQYELDRETAKIYALSIGKL